MEVYTLFYKQHFFQLSPQRCPPFHEFSFRCCLGVVYCTEPSSPEAGAQRCSVKKVFLEISHNSRENTCVRVSFLIKLQALSLKQPPEGFCKKDVPRNFAKFTGKHLCQSLFFNKVAGLRPAFSLKKRLWRRCFPVNFVKHLFLQNTSGGCF